MPDLRGNIPSSMVGLSGRLKMARRARGWAVTELGERADVDIGTISRTENDIGIEGRSATLLVRLAEALDVPVGWLIANEGPAPEFLVGGGGGGRKTRRRSHPKLRLEAPPNKGSGTSKGSG